MPCLEEVDCKSLGDFASTESSNLHDLPPVSAVDGRSLVLEEEAIPDARRRHTLEKVTTAIIQHQRAFLDRGPEFIEPLKMQQVADLVGVHVTTVSRAVDDKWVQTPRGIFPLKRFFGGGTQTSSGEEVAWQTIKQKLRELVGNEHKANRL